jgi:rRNA maturation endonuclease Nob1
MPGVEEGEEESMTMTCEKCGKKCERGSIWRPNLRCESCGGWLKDRDREPDQATLDYQAEERRRNEE